MLNVKTNGITDKGVLRPAVRTAIRDGINELSIGLSNGSVEALEYKGNGDYFGPIAVCEDGTTVYAKVSLTITTSDYKAPAPKAKTAKVPEVIDIE